jgi:hypothetical protein
VRLLAGGAPAAARHLNDLFLCLALATLALATLFFGVVPAVVSDEPSAFSTWSALLGRLVGAVLFAAAAFAPERPVPRRARATLLVATAATGVLVTIAVLIGLLSPHLPRGIEPDVTPVSPEGPWLHGHPDSELLRLGDRPRRRFSQRELHTHLGQQLQRRDDNGELLCQGCA